MKTTLITVFFLVISLTAYSQAQTIGRGALTIQADNFRSDEGKVIAKLYRKEDDMPDKPFMEISDAIHNGKAVIVFADILYGEYAAIVCHDKNANDKIDHNFLGIPTEPLGFSNGWTLTLFSGMPSFSKLAFEFCARNNEYKINIE